MAGTAGRAARLLVLAAISLTALAVPAGSPARTVAVAPPTGADWNADARTVRGQTGKQFVFVCPADGQTSQVWGTDVYTDDSSVCSAAVHTGKITTAVGGTVTVELRAGEASYTGSTRNRVASADYGAWSGSFVVVSAVTGGGVAGVKMGGGDWTATASAHRGQNGTRFGYLCPSNGPVSTSVWGTNIYTDDSSVCTAAVQVGVVTRAGGGSVTIEIRPGQSSYDAFTANGITSRAYPSYSGSFVFAGAPRIPGSPSPGGGGGGGGTTTTGGGGGAAAAPPTATTNGTVLVNGQPFTGGTIPYGATVDVTEGTVTLRADVGTLKVTGAGNITAAFKLIRGVDKKKPIVELRLVKGDFSVCPKRKPSSASATATPVVRQLWGDGKGKFRTRGRYSSATVRGTKWLTADRCDGTFTRVQRGVIAVADFPNRQQITLRAPRTYLARP